MLQAPFTVSQMRKFADKLRNFSKTPTPEGKPSGGQHQRRHTTLSAPGTYTPAAHSSAARDSVTPESSWAASSLSPEFAPQKLLGQFGSTPQPLSTAKKAGHGTKHHHHHQASHASPAVASSGSAMAAVNTAATAQDTAVAGTTPAVAQSDSAVAIAGLRQHSEGQMMLLPAGVAMNDLLALADEMDPDVGSHEGSPEERKGRREKRMLTANSTMQLAAYLASKVGL